MVRQTGRWEASGAEEAHASCLPACEGEGAVGDHQDHQGAVAWGGGWACQEDPLDPVEEEASQKGGLEGEWREGEGNCWGPPIRWWEEEQEWGEEGQEEQVWPWGPI